MKYVETVRHDYCDAEREREKEKEKELGIGLRIDNERRTVLAHVSGLVRKSCKICPTHNEILIMFRDNLKKKCFQSSILPFPLHYEQVFLSVCYLFRQLHSSFFRRVHATLYLGMSDHRSVHPSVRPAEIFLKYTVNHLLH